MPVDFSYLDKCTVDVFGGPVIFGYGSNFARSVSAIVDRIPITDPETGMTTVAVELTTEPHADYVENSHWLVDGILLNQAAPPEPDNTLVKIFLVRRNAQP